MQLANQTITTGGMGLVTITGTMAWTGGTIDATGTLIISGTLNAFAATGSLTCAVSGDGTVNFIDGTADIDGPYTVYTTHITGGEADFNGTVYPVNLTLSAGDMGGSGWVAITGTMAWTGGTVDATGTLFIANGATLNASSPEMSLPLVFDNYGTTNVDAGTLSLDGGGTAIGNFVVSSILKFTKDYTLAAASSVTGGGAVAFTSGTTTVAGTYTVTTTNITGAEVDFNGTESPVNLPLSGGDMGGTGTVTITGTMAWTGGTIDATGTLIIVGTLNAFAATGSLNCSITGGGTINFMGGNATILGPTR